MSTGEHWAVEQVKRLIVRAIVEYSKGEGMAIAARRSADEIIALITPARSAAKYRDALEEINTAVINGTVCDDVAWFDNFTTLHDFIEETLRPSAPAAVADLFIQDPGS